MKIVKIYLLLLLALGGLIVLPAIAMQESHIVNEQLCYRCENMPGIKNFNIFYRCKTPHSEKLCQNCHDLLITSSKTGKNPARCPVCAMNSRQLPNNTSPCPFELTPEETAWIRGTSNGGSSSASSSRVFVHQEASCSFRMMYLCIAAVTVGLGKYVWNKIKRNKKTLPTRQISNIPDTTTPTDKQ